MKKHIPIYLVLVLLLASTTAKAQPYKSIFGDSVSIWIAGYHALGTDVVVATTTIDTNVNGLWYKKLVHYGNAYVSTPISYQPSLGLIREDTISGKAWYRSLPDNNTYKHPDRDTVEKLIMDMSLKVGDSFYTHFFYPDTLLIVDSVFYDSSNHKNIRFGSQSLAYNGKFRFIETVGTTLGVTYMDSNALYIRPNWNPHGGLICAFHDSEHIFMSPLTIQYGGKCIPTSSISQLSKYQQLPIYPNPNNGEFTISIPTLEATEIVIANINGKVVYNTTVQHKKQQSVNLNNQPKGIYIIQLTDPQNSYTNKLMIE